MNAKMIELATIGLLLSGCPKQGSSETPVATEPQQQQDDMPPPSEAYDAAERQVFDLVFRLGEMTSREQACKLEMGIGEVQGELQRLVVEFEKYESFVAKHRGALTEVMLAISGFAQEWARQVCWAGALDTELIERYANELEEAASRLTVLLDSDFENVLQGTLMAHQLIVAHPDDHSSSAVRKLIEVVDVTTKRAIQLTPSMEPGFTDRGDAVRLVLRITAAYLPGGTTETLLEDCKQLAALLGRKSAHVSGYPLAQVHEFCVGPLSYSNSSSPIPNPAATTPPTPTPPKTP